jgi:hypothetical protein
MISSYKILLCASLVNMLYDKHVTTLLLKHFHNKHSMPCIKKKFFFPSNRVSIVVSPFFFNPGFTFSLSKNKFHHRNLDFHICLQEKTKIFSPRLKFPFLVSLFNLSTPPQYFNHRNLFIFEFFLTMIQQPYKFHFQGQVLLDFNKNLWKHSGGIYLGFT